MLRLKCHKCGRNAFTGTLKIINEEQLFECWHCMRREEQEMDRKLKEVEEKELPDMPPFETKELVFGPYFPKYGPSWNVTAENDLVNRQV